MVELNKKHQRSQTQTVPFGLVIRTLPNVDEQKKVAEYSGKNPPFLSSDAISFVKSLGVNNLIVDLPSIDREDDEGKLSGHCSFFEFDKDAQISVATDKQLSRNTVTEFCFVPSFVKDGFFMCELQIAPFNCDASPSRPLLYPATNLNPTSTTSVSSDLNSVLFSSGLLIALFGAFFIFQRFKK